MARLILRRLDQTAVEVLAPEMAAPPLLASGRKTDQVWILGASTASVNIVYPYARFGKLN